jgi:transcriptional regulator with XRE-family HTH domain
MDMIGRIRRLHSRKNKSAREISRITGLSRNTVAKWLQGQVDGPPKYRRGEQPNKLTAFHEALQQALKAVSCSSFVLHGSIFSLNYGVRFSGARSVSSP